MTRERSIKLVAAVPGGLLAYQPGELQQSIIDFWTLGGGTAMMLQIDHRESRDIDIFIADPQTLGFLDPQTHDFNFEMPLADSVGDGVSFRKLVFKNIGEIDFIVGHAMTSSPTTRTSVEGKTVLLETIPEIIAKKIYYRGASIKPRDIFDIAAAAEEHADAVVEALRSYRDEVKTTLSTMGKLNPDFVTDAIAQLAIKDRYRPVAKTALERAKKILLTV